ncbi:hypothetical protein K439DRAFT_1620902 [Ramaria rubella]|nr:hypothetical protein K439DRAFT_1620902 [Ramaria rubella]
MLPIVTSDRGEWNYPRGGVMHRRKSLVHADAASTTRARCCRIPLNTYGPVLFRPGALPPDVEALCPDIPARCYATAYRSSIPGDGAAFVLRVSPDLSWGPWIFGVRGAVADRNAKPSGPLQTACMSSCDPAPHHETSRSSFYTLFSSVAQYLFHVDPTLRLAHCPFYGSSKKSHTMRLITVASTIFAAAQVAFSAPMYSALVPNENLVETRNYDGQEDLLAREPGTSLPRGNFVEARDYNDQADLFTREEEFANPATW